MSLCTPRLTSPYAPQVHYDLDKLWNACAVPHRPGQFLLAGTCSLILVDAATRETVRKYAFAGEEIMCVAPVTDDGVFVCGGDYRRLHFFHVDHEDEIAPVLWRSGDGDDDEREDDDDDDLDALDALLVFRSQISAVAMSPCGGKIACGTRWDGMRILCLNVEKNNEAPHGVIVRVRGELQQNELSVDMGASLAWTPDARHLLFVEERDRVRAAVADTFESVAQVGGDIFSSVAVSPSGRYIALAGRRSIIVVEGIEGVKSAAAASTSGGASADASSFVLSCLDGVCACDIAFLDELVLAVSATFSTTQPALRLFSIATGRCIDRVGRKAADGFLALGAPKSRKRGGGATTVHQRDVLVPSVCYDFSFTVFGLEQDEVTEVAAENDGEGDMEVSTRRKRVN